MIRKIEIERFSLTSSKPFDQVVAAVNAAIGHPCPPFRLRDIQVKNRT